MSVAGKNVLLADIGGTNARFAVAEDDRIRLAKSYAVENYARPADVIRAFFQEVGLKTIPEKAILAVAGPVESGRARLTNGAWQFDAGELAAELGLSRVDLVNDFAALARGLPQFTPKDLLRVGGGVAKQDAPSVVIGPGTGLGMGIFVPVADGVALATEGGHVTLAAEDRKEAEILSRLRDRNRHVSAELVLSGGGLERLYEVLRTIDSAGGPLHRSADEITEMALAGDCALCGVTLRTFCAMLGSFAGNVALTIGARGGVYLAGGIVPRFPEFLARSEFRNRFEAKGRFRDWLSMVPTHVVTRPDPAFAGLLAMQGRPD